MSFEDQVFVIDFCQCAFNFQIMDMTCPSLRQENRNMKWDSCFQWIIGYDELYNFKSDDEIQRISRYTSSSTRDGSFKSLILYQSDPIVVMKQFRGW